MNDHLGVGGGLENCALLHQLGAQGISVGEIAIVGDGDTAARQIRKQGLDVAHRRAARCRIAVMTDGVFALEVGGVGAVFAEDIADQTGMAFGDELTAIVGNHASRFLAAVLQRVQTEHGQGAGAGVAENAEYTTLLVQ